MIFYIRHGERADLSNLKSERSKIKVSFDPHLTKIGHD